MKDKGVLLTTYDIVRNNSKSLRGDFYFKDELDEDNVTWDYMILDEVGTQLWRMVSLLLNLGSSLISCSYVDMSLLPFM